MSERAATEPREKVRMTWSWRSSVSVVSLTLFASSGLHAQSWECQQVLVPMRDGVRLATDVYVPRGQGAGPFPVVIERTPYDKGDCENVHAQYFAARGYVAMVQDVDHPSPLVLPVIPAQRR